MTTARKLFCVFMFMLILFSGTVSAFSAEVYYLGGAGGGEEAGKNKSFSLKERVKDLFDFKSYGEYSPDRSGRISGTISEEISWTNIGGNDEKSFFKKGVFQNTELTLNVQERLWSDYNLDGQMFMRKTDDRRIEPRKDVRLKQIDFTISNEHNLLRFGDFYGDFSQFVMGTSLEGFNLELSNKSGWQIKSVAGRKNEADDASNLYTRYVFGGKLDYTMEKEDFIIPYLRTGIQAVTSQDDPGSLPEGWPAQSMVNSVASIDGEIRFPKYFSMTYEVAGSSNRQDTKDPSNKKKQGTALRIQPMLKIFGARFKYLFYVVTPSFYTDAGSAMADKIQHQFSLNWKLHKKVNVSFVENYYWDQLPGSTKTRKTVNDEKYMTVNMRPFSKRPSLSIRPYVNLLSTNCSDLGNSLESTTNTYGVSLNDSLAGGRINYGTFYEYRYFNDIGNEKAGSDIYTRFGGNIGLDTKLFGRRLYLSDDLTMDFRATKTDDNPDITVTNSINATYDLFKRCTVRFGNNIQQTDGGAPGTNLTNTRFFGEVNFLINKKRNCRLIVRLEENLYKPEDGSQGYSEDRVVTKIVTNF